MRTLVGSTGFVGGNLLRYGAFDAWYHSTDIEDAFGTKPDLLYYAGVRAEKYLANRFPEQDAAAVENAIKNIERINPKAVVLISTVDIYPSSAGADETAVIDAAKLQPYGANRRLLEQFVEARFEDRLILRLPGLYGDGLKKNFLYDMISFFPSKLREEKIEELGKPFLERFYHRDADGFFSLCPPEGKDESALRAFFENAGFSALSFTDSRAVFQFYPLRLLFGHSRRARSAGLSLVNAATEPCEASELYGYIFGRRFENRLSALPPYYDMRTRYDAVFGGGGGYLMGKEDVMRDIRQFVLKRTEKR